MNSKIGIVVMILFAGVMVRAQDLKHIADSIRRASQIPELGYAVIWLNKVPEVEVMGYRRMDLQNESTKANKSDYFHLGSNSKAITGWVASHLVILGKIKWDTRFFDLYPEWKQASDSSHYNTTLQDLLSHRGGIQPFTNGFEHAALPAFKGNVQEKRRAFAEYLLKRPRKYVPSDTMHYSNAGYTLAALMLEKVSGKSWEKLIEKEMKRLKFSVRFGWPNKTDNKQPYGHWKDNDTIRTLPGNINYDLSLIAPAGDISMNLPQYARYISLHLRGLNSDIQTKKAYDYQFLHYGLPGYAIGWQNVNTADEQVSKHTGSAGTFFCYSLIDKKKNMAYVIVTNISTSEARAGIFYLMEKMRAMNN